MKISMKKYGIWLFTLALLAMIGACGGILNSQIDDYEYANSSGGRFEDTGSGLYAASSVLIRFVDISEVSPQHARYRTSFLLDDNGSIEFVLQGNSTLGQGVRIEIRRDKSEYKTEIKGIDFNLNLAAATNNTEVSLDIELDNGIPRLLIWTNGRTTPAAAAFDSDEDIVIDPGPGAYWGINIMGGTLTRAQKTEL